MPENSSIDRQFERLLQYKRNLDHGAGKWSGMTFKNILLPLWVGNYEYQGKAYRIFIITQVWRFLR